MQKLKDVSSSMHSDTMNPSETERLKAATAAYTQVLTEFSTKLYQNAAPEAGAEPTDYGPNHDDNIVDGDFTEQQ